jgi:hypothetical protein
MLAVAVLVWLIGAILGWCAGWAARGEQNHAWHRTLARQLVKARDELAETLTERDRTRDQWHATRIPPPAPTVVHVHLTSATPPPWPAPRPLASDMTRSLHAMPVLPAEEVPS